MTTTNPQSDAASSVVGTATATPVARARDRRRSRHRRRVANVAGLMAGLVLTGAALLAGSLGSLGVGLLTAR